MLMDPETVQPLLKSLADASGAVSVDVLAVDGGIPLASWGHVRNAGLPGPDITTVREAVHDLVRQAADPDSDDSLVSAAVLDFQLMAHELRYGNFRGAMCMVGPASPAWSDKDRELLALAAELCAAVYEAAKISQPHGRLEALVSRIGSELMGVSAPDAADAIHRVLSELGRYFGADVCVLRYNDPALQASVLIDQWPPRENVPDPDPLGIVPWDTDDPVFAMIKDLREPYTVRPGDKQRDYQKRVEAGTGISEVSMAAVPLISGDTTRGVLGLIHYGDRIWTKAEIRALRAIASLLVQVDARVTAEEKLHHYAYHDELTGLMNRRAFVEYLSSTLSTNPGAPIAVLFADMDRLKTVNDVLGHAVGDLFIQAVAKRLRESVRPHDLVARLAGDEFVMIIHDIDSVHTAERVARRILDRVAEPIDVGGHQISRSASIGLAVNNGATGTVDELLGNADIALLEAKEHGGDSIVAFNDELHSKILVRADLELRLRTAIGNNEMRLYFQPEFDLRTGRMTAAEALVRWQHPEHGLLTADSFISVLEEINLAAELGRWVLDGACRQLAEWKKLGESSPPTVRVNISAGELISADFVDFVARMLDRYTLTPAELGIEITESSVMRELDDVQATLSGLRALGVKIAIDDFGTGYSSLAQLKQLPVDILKIDRSFVSSLAESRNDREIVAAIVRLAEAFDLTTVAEGVEDAAAVTALLDLGCTHAQGFYMSKPLPADAVLSHAAVVPLGTA